MSQCKDCKSDLKTGATKCSECGSYQDWRRTINSTQLLLGFILLVLTVQPVKDLFFGTSPRVKASVVGANSEQLWIVVANTGKGPATLESARVTANKKGVGAWESVLSFDNIQDRILKPGEVKVVPIRHGHRIPELVGPGVVTDRPRDDCNLIVRYYELSGTHVDTLTPFRCYVERKQ